MSGSSPGDATTTPWIPLRTAGISLRGDQVLGDAALVTLVIEDLCWEIDLADLTARTPPRWRRRQLTRWNTERTALDERADQLREQARASGIQVR